MHRVRDEKSFPKQRHDKGKDNVVKKRMNIENIINNGATDRRENEFTRKT